MAKIYGLFGAMTGKVADAVMLVRNGEQIVRKYQPIVSNPSTPEQVAVRAKLKLLSQLSAVLASVIAMVRVGAVSARNLFTKVNYPFVSYADGEAEISLPDVKLTSSVVALPSLSLVAGGDDITVALSRRSNGQLSRVVYVMIEKQSDGKMRLIRQGVVSDAGDSGDFQWNSSVYAANFNGVVLAYGVRDNTEKAKVIFGNLTALTAESVATLLTTRRLLESDVTLTETQGLNIVASANNMSAQLPQSSETRTSKKK